MKYYRDLKNSLDTAKEEGIEEGIKQGIKTGLERGREERTLELVRSLLDNGVPVEIISKSTGQTIAQIKSLKPTN